MNRHPSSSVLRRARGALLLCAAPMAPVCGAFLFHPGETQEVEPVAVHAAEETGHTVRIEGTVLLPGGAPARGAVVVSSAGGQAAVGEDGAFVLEAVLARGALAVELTAAASGHAGALTARCRLDGLWNASARHAGTLVLAQSHGCSPQWAPTFGGLPGVDGDVKSLAVFDDGSGAGPALFAGGSFTVAGGFKTGGLARWNGHAWSVLDGGGIGGFAAPVSALIVFDDGTGAALYAGGSFTSAGGQSANHIARWDGKSWSALGGGLNADVRALEVFDDGSGAGPALYAGGLFTTAGGQPANRIARWDGQGWSALGGGMTEGVLALEVFDDGSGAGPALYAGGAFTTVDGLGVPKIACWDGQGWSALSGGTSDWQVIALAVFDDGSGSGPALYAGGSFTTIGGVSASRIAQWDGQAWSALGSGMNAHVWALSVFDDGSGAGPALFAGGSFTLAGGQEANRIAKWDGQSWSEFAGGLGAYESDDVTALAVFDDGSGTGPGLIAGGRFGYGTAQDASSIAGWNGQGWAALGSGLDWDVRAMEVFDDGSGRGPALYAGGAFTSASGQILNGIARWEGTGWSPLDAGFNGSVFAMTVFDDGSGSGPALYVGGGFTAAANKSAQGIARWDGQSWSPVGGGVDDIVRALVVLDDGSGAGPALYAAGDFDVAGGQAAQKIARWDGQAWSVLGSGLDKHVRALTVFDDGSGSGPALIAGGDFFTAGGTSVWNVARWDGASWSALGSELSTVFALAVFDDGSGSGPALYAGGAFYPSGNVARWNGLAWSPVGGGTDSVVYGLVAFDDGPDGGPALYAGGAFDVAGGVSAQRIARWDGQAWSALASGLSSGIIEDHEVYALAGFDDGSGTGPALFAGGSFTASSAGDSYIAKWGCPAVDTLPGCFGNPAQLASPAGDAAIGGTFDVSLSSSQLATGLGLLFLGLDGTDASGCGLLVPGIGELLLALAPEPVQVGAGSLSGGQVGFPLPVPNDPGLVGVEVALHGVIVGLFAPGLPIELSNGLRVTITQ